MTITVAGFREKFPISRFPQFATLTDEEIQTYLDLAVAQINKPAWDACNLYEIGVYYLAAHYLQLYLDAGNGGSGISGPISSQSVGDVSLAYQSYSVNGITLLDTFYLQTTFGRTFLSWMRLVGVGLLVVC